MDNLGEEVQSLTQQCNGVTGKPAATPTPLIIPTPPSSTKTPETGCLRDRPGGGSSSTPLKAVVLGLLSPEVSPVTLTERLEGYFKFLTRISKQLYGDATSMLTIYCGSVCVSVSVCLCVVISTVLRGSEPTFRQSKMIQAVPPCASHKRYVFNQLMVIPCGTAHQMLYYITDKDLATLLTLLLSKH